MDRQTYERFLNYKLTHCQTEIKQELVTAAQYEVTEKDILIVVKDELKYVQYCIESVQENTKNYQLYIWDNASEKETKEYLESLRGIHLHRNNTNQGFIVPNNRLAELGTSPYIILLNSDTAVEKDWDKALIAWLQQNPNVAIVGYAGSKLNSEFMGSGLAFGTQIDYVSGYCMCLRRETYKQFGLFDEKNLEFAYGEDADFSLRMKEAGKEIYALHLDYVHHFENKTADRVRKTMDFSTFFTNNHNYLKRRYGPK